MSRKGKKSAKGAFSESAGGNLTRRRVSIPRDATYLKVCGPQNSHLALFSEIFGAEQITLSQGIKSIDVFGPDKALVEKVAEAVRVLKRQAEDRPDPITADTVREFLHKIRPESFTEKPRSVYSLQPRNQHQADLLDAIERHDVTLAIGPAGTGKTYLAMAAAIKALRDRKVKRIVLIRPAVPAGEELGFLPGSKEDKVDPYMRPFQDALRDMCNPAEVEKWKEKGIIEIAPLAFMRGRTIKDSFLIFDEAQNASYEQIKMLLTRHGQGSIFAITGDLEQSDLPQFMRGRQLVPGLKIALEIAEQNSKMGVVKFDASDVVRHPIVSEWVTGFEAWEARRDQVTAEYEGRPQPPVYRPS
jgi:phosphate starvation-inducible PhoH-like protein